jgi:hypothetical protein
MTAIEQGTGPGMGSNDLINWVERAVQEGLLQPGSPGYELAQRALRQGLDSLSHQEREGYLTRVVPALNEMARRQFARQALLSRRLGAPRATPLRGAPNNT